MSEQRSDISPSPHARTVQAAWLAMANFLQFNITLIISAILSRYMAADEYGTFRQVLYVYGTLLTVFSLGLPKAYSYFLARLPIDEGRCAVRKLNFIAVALSSLFAAVLFFGSGFIASLMGNPQLDASLRMFAAVPVMLMPVLGVESILTVYGMARKVVTYVIISRCFTVTCTVLPVTLLGLGLEGAVAGFVVSSGITCVAGLCLSSLPFREATGRHKCCRLTVTEILRFAMPVFYSGIYGFIIASASQFFVSRYFGVEDFAVFANGYHELPLASMVIGAVAGTLLPEFSRMSKEGKDSSEFLSLWKNVMIKSSMVIYPLSVFFFVYAPDIIIFLYGEDYYRSATLFRIVSIINLARIVPYGPLLFAVGKGQLFANVHLVTAATLIGLLLLCVNFFPSLEAIALISTTCTVFAIALMMASISRILNAGIIQILPWAQLTKLLIISVSACLISRIAISHIVPGGVFSALISGFILFSMIYLLVSKITGFDYHILFKSIYLPAVRRN